MEQEFKNDYYNNLTIDEMKGKYGIGNTTYFALLKKLNIKRRPSSKISRILGDSYNNIEKSKTLQKQKPTYIPKKIEPKPDILDDELIYEKQYVPRNTEIEVNKTKPKPVAKKQIKEVDSNELDAILNRADKTFTKIQNKKQSKIAENKNK
tara:strand:+ start:186 stop:638 length:453 start_codon:yes stop_codon:yes gene_type:complete